MALLHTAPFVHNQRLQAIDDFSFSSPRCVPIVETTGIAQQEGAHVQLKRAQHMRLYLHTPSSPAGPIQVKNKHVGEPSIAAALTIAAAPAPTAAAAAVAAALGASIKASTYDSIDFASIVQLIPVGTRKLLVVCKQLQALLQRAFLVAAALLLLSTPPPLLRVVRLLVVLHRELQRQTPTKWFVNALREWLLCCPTPAVTAAAFADFAHHLPGAQL
jgi:hypothetical protein